MRHYKGDLVCMATGLVQVIDCPRLYLLPEISARHLPPIPHVSRRPRCAETRLYFFRIKIPISRMESIRKRFLPQTPVEIPPIHTISLPNQLGLRVYNDERVTLYNLNEEVDITTIQKEKEKICALEALYANLRYEGRNRLNAEREGAVVCRIIQTFPTKESYVSAISRHAVASDSKSILSEWANDVWTMNVTKELPKEDDDDEDSPAGSLFSDSEIEKQPTNRVRPITLRPRRFSISTREHSMVPNSEMSNENRPPTTYKPTSPSTPWSSELVKHLVRSSQAPLPTSRKESESPTSTPSTPSKPSRRSKIATSVVPKKRLTKPANPDPAPKKVKTSNTNETTAKSQQPSRNDNTRIIIPPPAGKEPAQDYVSRYWKQVSAKFPAEIRGLPTIDRLAHYFRETELIRKENEIIKRDELERRQSMVLLGEKIKLMNQQLRPAKADGGK